MIRRQERNGGVLLALASQGLVWLVACGASASAETIIFDEGFSQVNPAIWRVPPIEEVPYQQTYPWLDRFPQVVGGAVRLTVMTYNEFAPGGKYFLGSDIQTYESFGPNIAIEARARWVDPFPDVPLGVSQAIFTWEYRHLEQRKNEIDFELFGNQAATTNQIATNKFANTEIEGRGVLELHSIPGFSMYDWHRYRIEWLPDRIRWLLVDDNNYLIRELVGDVPQLPSHLRLNLWVPDVQFEEAYHESLQPAATPEENRTFHFDVDRITVYSHPTSSPWPDLTGDGAINREDLSVLVRHFGTANGATYYEGDINGDGRVSLLDLVQLRRHFGEVRAISAAAVPEPAAIVMIASVLLFGGICCAMTQPRRRTADEPAARADFERQSSAARTTVSRGTPSSTSRRYSLRPS